MHEWRAAVGGCHRTGDGRVEKIALSNGCSPTIRVVEAELAGQDTPGVGPRLVSERLYLWSFFCMRFSSDLSLGKVHAWPGMIPFVGVLLDSKLPTLYTTIEDCAGSSKPKQYALTFLLLVLAGFPWTPVAFVREKLVFLLVHTGGFLSILAGVVLSLFLALVSTWLFWIIVAKVLNPRRFRHRGDFYVQEREKVEAGGRWGEMRAGVGSFTSSLASSPMGKRSELRSASPSDLGDAVFPVRMGGGPAE